MSVPKSKAYLFPSGLLLIIGLLSGGRAYATPPNNTPKGITLSPFLQQISIRPTDTQSSFNLNVTNQTDSLQEVDLSTHDFGSLNNSGGVLLEGDDSSYGQKYGLTSWLALGTDTLVLSPHETRSVPVTIDNRESLQPGGHYGAVVASVNSLNDQSGNHVVINQQLLSLILVDKMGGEHYNLKLDNTTQNGNWLHLPNDIKLRFQNPGNVHVVPRGVVKLKTPTGKVLAQGIINSESAYILPESFRELYVPLTIIRHAAPLPGLYHVEVDYRYDGIQSYARQSYAVRFVSLPLYAGLIILLVTVIGAGRYFYRKKYSKKITTTD